MLGNFGHVRDFGKNRRDKFQLYKIHLVQELSEDDFDNWFD